MNTETKQLRGKQIKGIIFCLVCMLSVYGLSRLVSHILGRDVFENDNYFIIFMGVEIIFTVAAIALLFSPKLFWSAIKLIANKKIEEQTGCQNIMDEAEQNEAAIRTVMSKGDAPVKVACNDKGVMRLLKYMQRIDKTVKKPRDFFERVKQKDFARKYLTDITILISNSTTDKKAELCWRFLYAFVYDFADDQLASIEDTKAKIENMRSLICELSSSGGNKERRSVFYLLVYGILRGAYQQEDYKSVVDGYGLLCSPYLTDAEVNSEIKSAVYEMVGAAKLHLRDKNGIPYLKLALSCNPDNLSVLLRLANYYFCRYDYVNTYEYAGRCFALLPDHDSMDEELNKVGDALSLMVYMSSFALGKLNEAYATVSAMDERGGDDASLKGNRAYLAFKCEKYEEAERYVRQAWELEPNTGSVLNVKGMLALRKGMYPEAIKAFRGACKYFTPSKDHSLERFFYGEICNNLAVALYKNSEQEAARKWFDKAMAVGYPDVSVDIMDGLPTIACPKEKK